MSKPISVIAQRRERYPLYMAVVKDLKFDPLQRIQRRKANELLTKSPPVRNDMVLDERQPMSPSSERLHDAVMAVWGPEIEFQKRASELSEAFARRAPMEIPEVAPPPVTEQESGHVFGGPGQTVTVDWVAVSPASTGEYRGSFHPGGPTLTAAQRTWNSRLHAEPGQPPYQSDNYTEVDGRGRHRVGRRA